MEIEENHHDDSFDSTNHHETLERFNATMDQRNNTTTTSRIIQSDSIVQMEMSNGDDTMAMDEPPTFPKLSVAQSSSATNGGGGKSSKIEYRRIRCPAHRYTPLREHWEQILTPLVEYLKLQVRTRTNGKNTRARHCPHKTEEKKDETGIHKASSVVLGTSNPLGSHCRSGMKISRRFYIVRSLIFYIYSWVVDGF